MIRTIVAVLLLAGFGAAHAADDQRLVLLRQTRSHAAEAAEIIELSARGGVTKTYSAGMLENLGEALDEDVKQARKTAPDLAPLAVRAADAVKRHDSAGLRGITTVLL